MKEIALTYAPPKPIQPQSTNAAHGAATGPNQGFQDYLKDALGDVNTLTQQADHAIKQLVGEGKGDVQETILAMEKADVSFRLMMQIRNKILDAYQEIVRMQV